MKDFHGLFSAFSFLIENEWHMHLGPNNFFIGFLKSATFVTHLMFSGSKFHIESQVFLDVYHQKLLFYDFLQIDFVFYDLHTDIDETFLS